MDRRKFISTVGIGSIPVIGGSLASCESVNDSATNTNWTDDFNVMKNVANIEAVAINTYQAAIDTYISADNKPLAELFKSHHQDHLDAYNATLMEKDWAPVSAVGVDPDSRVATEVSDELSALKLALKLEYEAASFYYQKITEEITTEKVRMLFTNIFPMEVGHVVTFKTALGLDNPNGATGLFQDLTNGLT